jgi:hypothetical protein
VCIENCSVLKASGLSGKVPFSWVILFLLCMFHACSFAIAGESTRSSVGNCDYCSGRVATKVLFQLVDLTFVQPQKPLLAACGVGRLCASNMKHKALVNDCGAISRRRDCWVSVADDFRTELISFDQRRPSALSSSEASKPVVSKDAALLMFAELSAEKRLWHCSPIGRVSSVPLVRFQRQGEEIAVTIPWTLSPSQILPIVDNGGEWQLLVGYVAISGYFDTARTQPLNWFAEIRYSIVDRTRIRVQGWETFPNLGASSNEYIQEKVDQVCVREGSAPYL